MLNASSCEDCPSGYYAPTAQAESCLECSAGDHTEVTSKATKCSSCDAGTYSAGRAVNCSICEAGKASSTRASVCYDCEAGKRSDRGAPTCSSCGAGTYSSVQGSTECLNCTKGTYALSEGSSECGQWNYQNWATNLPLCGSFGSSPQTHPQTTTLRGMQRGLLFKRAGLNELLKMLHGSRHTVHVVGGFCPLLTMHQGRVHVTRQYVRIQARRGRGQQRGDDAGDAQFKAGILSLLIGLQRCVRMPNLRELQRWEDPGEHLRGRLALPKRFRCVSASDAAFNRCSASFIR